MPSQLRLQSSFEPVEAHTIHQTTSPVSPPPAKRTKRTMSLTQTYYVASTARSKLGREAARADHNLRRLVGHANMLDQLMVELSQAEAEQEAWFNASVRKASSHNDEPRHVQWVDTIPEAEDEDEDESGSDMDEDDEAELFSEMMPLRSFKTAPVLVDSEEVEDEDDEEEYYEDDAPMHSPPELTYEAESDSEEDDMPASPENASLALSEKDREAAARDMKARLEGNYSQQPIIAAC